MMPPRKGTKAWQGQILHYVVGWNEVSSSTSTFSVPNSGIIMCDGKRADANRSSAEHEAQVVFGLSKIRSFRPDDIQGMKEYRAELVTEHESGTE